MEASAEDACMVISIHVSFIRLYPKLRRQFRHNYQANIMQSMIYTLAILDLIV